jgi:hypothetical protein
MNVRRRNILLILGLVAGFSLIGCNPTPKQRLAHSVRRELAAGRDSADAWIQNAGQHQSQTDQAVLATAYFERLRLGLGSPFRLIDYALNDPRMAEPSRTTLGWALLAAVLDGKAYHIDPVVLDRAGTLGIQGRPGIGTEHKRIIERALDNADELNAAEIGLRSAYTIAMSEEIVTDDAPKLIAHVAALTVDRALARADAEALLRAVSSTQRPLDKVLRSWRDQRKLAVERPRTGVLDPEAEIESVRVLQDVLEDLRALAVSNTAGLWSKRAVESESPLLQGTALHRLSQLESALDLPPQTPIVIPARQLTREAVDLPWLTPAERSTRAKFGSRALNEESFVLEYARLKSESPHDGGPARAALLAAVGMRAYAQEPVWYPGMPAPSSRELRERYGFASISFDQTVPSNWRPYYRRMLGYALDDLYRVMPATNLRGLNVHFGAATLDVLAMHDPQRRRLILPPASSAGTLAHELAHDLDWQVALRRYRVRGDYATDRAGRTRDHALASRVRVLAASTASPAATITAHGRRPAEIFARHVDWYVAVSLAREGRRNGYLSSVQDELITGYGTVRPPDISGAAGDALMTILAELAPIYREQDDAFRNLYGKGRTQRAYDLVRRITEAPALPSAADAYRVVQVARDSALALISGGSCAFTRQSTSSDLQTARRSVVLIAAEARARGAAMKYAERWLGQRARQQLAAAFYGGPISVATDSINATAISGIATEVKAIAANGFVPADPFQLALSACLAAVEPF